VSNLQIALANRKLKLVLVFVVLLLFSSVGFITANATLLFSDNIYRGVTVGAIPVGGLSVDDAKKTILIAFKDRTSKLPLTLLYENKAWLIAPQDIELTINADELAKQAHHVGRTGNIINMLKERYLAVNSGYTVPFTQNYNYDKLYALLTTIAKEIDKVPQNSSLVYKDENIHITPEIWGQQVDILTSLTDITSRLNSDIPLRSELTVKRQSPLVVSQDFTDIDHLIAVYTTYFDPNNQNRYRNVALASESLTDLLVHSGEVFSFNQSIGLRLPEYGYREAPVFVDGKLLLDWGGGVCQVSSTLYNVALLADMEIEERSSHFQPPGYVPLGQDATVADNLLDFKFKNSSPYNVYIISEMFNNHITISIFGKKIADPGEIHIESAAKSIEYNTIMRQDPSLALGQRIIESVGQKGFEVTHD